MPKVEMTINIDRIWDRYHAGKTTPDDVRRLLLAYDGATTERAQLQREAEHTSTELARVTAERDDARAALAHALRRAL